MAYSSLAIANEFIKRASTAEPREQLTHMQLQKLVYLAHGWNLAVIGDALVSDQFEAWDYGPVVRRLFDALTRYGRNPIPRYINWGDDTPFRSDDRGPALVDTIPNETGVINAVWENYGKFPAFKLSALTHEDDSPWHKAYQWGGNTTIDNDEIKEYFRNLAHADVR